MLSVGSSVCFFKHLKIVSEITLLYLEHLNIEGRELVYSFYCYGCLSFTCRSGYLIQYQVTKVRIYVTSTMKKVLRVVVSYER